METIVDKKCVPFINEMAQTFRDEMEKMGIANPFAEKWKKGRPTLEMLMRRDLSKLWWDANKPKISQMPFLQALLKGPEIITLDKSKHPVRIKYIQRGAVGMDNHLNDAGLYITDLPGISIKEVGHGVSK